MSELVGRLADAFLDVLGPDVELDEDRALQQPWAAEFAALAGFTVPPDVEFGLRDGLTRLGVLRGDTGSGPRAGEFGRPGSFREAAVGHLVQAVVEEFRASGNTPGPGLPAELRVLLVQEDVASGTEEAEAEDVADFEGELPVRFLRAFDGLGVDGVRLTAAGDLRVGDAREIGRALGRPLGAAGSMREVDWLSQVWDLLRRRGDVLVSVHARVVTAEIHPRWR